MKIAVYGTLRKKNHKNSLMVSEHSEYLGTFQSEPIFSLHTNKTFPMLKKDGFTSVTFEVYEVKDVEQRKRIDAYEGYVGKDNKNNLYDKLVIQTPFGRALTYVFRGNVDNYPTIESGDWNEYKQYTKLTAL